MLIARHRLEDLEIGDVVKVEVGSTTKTIKMGRLVDIDIKWHRHRYKYCVKYRNGRIMTDDIELPTQEELECWAVMES